MGLFDQDIANSSKVSAEDKAKYKAAMDEADAKEEARYKSGPDREEMARKRKLDAMRKKRDKEEQPSHRWKPKPSESEKGSEGSSKPPKSSMDDLLKLMPIDTLEERILKTYGPNAPKRTGAGGEELPPGLKHGGKVDGCSSIQMSGRRPGKTY
jgi:hypothetical protein